MRLRATLILAATFLVLSTASAYPASLRRPPVQKVQVLYVLNASSGTFTPSGRGRYRLALHVAGDAIWIGDRPTRATGNMPAGELVRLWRSFGFAADPPNAVVDLVGGGRDDAVAVELTKPAFDARRHVVSFSARRLARAEGDLAHYRSATRPPASFASAALFVDDSTAPVVDGCVLEPYANCSGVDLSGMDLSGMNLTGIQITRFVGGTNVKLDGAILQNARFLGAYTTFTDSSFVGTDFSCAASVADCDATQPKTFLGSALLGVHFSSADLTNARFDNSEISLSVWTNSTLSGATFTGAIITESNFTGNTGLSLLGSFPCRSVEDGQNIGQSTCTS